MSTDLLSQAYNDNQKSDSEIEKELVEEAKKKIAERYKDNQRIMNYFIEGFKEVPKKREYPKSTDPNKMSPMQLISAGYEKLDVERKVKEKNTSKTINLNKEEI